MLSADDNEGPIVIQDQIMVDHKVLKGKREENLDDHPLLVLRSTISCEINCTFFISTA